MPTLRDDKLKALRDLVGADAAGALLLSLKERDKMASDMKIGFKASGELSPEDQDALLDAVSSVLDGTSEKCTPGTKDGKYMAKKAEDEESDADMEEDMAEEEDMDEEMLLSTADVKAIASEVSKALASSMSELKSYMKRGKSLDGGDTMESLKAYTEAQNEFSVQIVKSLEELLTRVKAIEEANGAGHTPSTSTANTTMNQIYGMSPTQHVENWLFNQR